MNSETGRDEDGARRWDHPSEHLRRSRIGALIARGRYDDASAALGVCWPEQTLPRQLRAALARGAPERITAFLEEFRSTPSPHFAIPAADLGIPHRPGLAELVLLLSVDAGNAGVEDGLETVVELAGSHMLDLAIGRVTGTEQAPNSLASARARAVALGEPLLGDALGRGMKRATLTLWADHGNPMIEMLAAGGRAIGDQILGPLSERGEEALTLRRTLRAYLATGGRANPTVRELGIHRNTLRHRLERIEALTECSLSSADDRAELWMALRLVTDADPRPADPEPAAGESARAASPRR
ncbi:helix-turn-helix domain-containing protein [Leucobacter weissii]|uniref:Helix-turn-helix domain-containing protein n=1 Tax=Leucobacter weissii TaxID=1983706 RepID=A0A939MUB4_9MICO|nr:helix-turn-helix domain-containing protein [Leucobacter weissii]MBO1903094.1 helix-turn-helix domain-containing protein [Leucobacter weissii]